MNRKIGVAVSGGGIRATAFHLGLFKWISEQKKMQDIKKISSVSGGSLCIGLIYACNNNKWPTNEEFLKNVLPEAKEKIHKYSIQNNVILKLLNPKYGYGSNSKRIKAALENKWKISGMISELPKTPEWYINCTTFETGKRFRFTQKNMGDYLIGYSEDMKIEISKAITASAGFPFLIGPTDFDCSKYKWEKSHQGYISEYTNNNSIIHLWDGGIYDNLGLGSMTIQNNRIKPEIDILLVSDASLSIQEEKRLFLHVNSPQRLIKVALSQINALRSNDVVGCFAKEKNGIYIKLGNSYQTLIDKINKANIKPECELIQHQTEDEAKIAYSYPTDLRKLSNKQLEALINHGYSVADNTFCIYFGKEW